MTRDLAATNTMIILEANVAQIVRLSMTATLLPCEYSTAAAVSHDPDVSGN
jgi:hypothetical protein